MVRLEEPWYLLGVLIAISVIPALAYFRNKTIERISRFARPELMPGYTAAEARKFRTKSYWLSIALVLLSVSLANPQWSTTKSTLSNSKADIFIVLDVSRSMTAEDVAPSRLDKAKQFLYRLLSDMKSNNTGLILFAGRAYLQMPLTEDAAAVSSFINGADPDMIPAQGTAIGPSIDLAQRMFSKDSQKGKMILIISDGEDHDADAVEKAKAAKKHGIIVNTIGVGTAEGGTMPVYNVGIKDVKKDDEGNPIITRLNKAALKEIATTGGGKYFNISEMDAAISYIASFASGKDTKNLRKQEFVDFESFFPWFLTPALLILLVLFFSHYLSGHSFTKRNISKKNTAPILILCLTTAWTNVFAQESMSAARNADKLYKDGKYAEAEQKYNTALKQHPDNQVLLYNRSNAQYQQNNFADAAKSYEKVIQSNADNQLKAKAYFNNGNTAFKQENYPEAVKNFRNSLKINPNDVDAKKNLSISLKKLKQQQQKDNKNKDQQDKNQDQKDQKQDQKDKNKEQDSQKQSAEEKQKSKEEAERLLKIIENEERNVMKKLPKQRSQEYVNDKDW